MKKKRILIVEDEYVAAANLEECLLTSGYIVTEIIPDGETAITKIEQNKPDLVMMDIKLNGKLSGTETAAIVRTRFNVPVIYLTAYSEVSIMKQVRLSDPYGYLNKPFRENELLMAVEMALSMDSNEKKLKADLKDKRTFEKLIPVCSKCKKIRNDKDLWMHVDEYLIDHTESKPTHGLCPSCAKELYAELSDENGEAEKSQD